MGDQGTPETVWWGDFSIPEGGTGKWRVGALSFWIERHPEEWRVAYVSTDDPFDGAVEIQIPAAADLPGEGLKRHRFGMRKTTGSVRITPVLPDRPVVSRPDTPYHVIAQEEVSLYVSSPVWVRIETGDPFRQLLELPVYRSSDTWFGASTREGELCYASRTSCRLTLEELPLRPHRVITRVRIRNRTEATILIERFNLPVPYLSVWAAPGGALWTQQLHLEIARETQAAEIRIAEQLPSQAGEATRVGRPRENEGKGILTRTLGALIG